MTQRVKGGFSYTVDHRRVG